MRAWLLLLMLFSLPLLAQQVDPSILRALTQADQSQQSGDLGTAEQLLRAQLGQAREGSLELALLQQRLGYLAIARERNTEAIDWLQRAVAQGQLSAEALRQDRLNLAQLMVLTDQPRSAAQLLSDLHSEQPLAEVHLRLLVQLYNQLGDYGRAIPLAEQVVRSSAAVDPVWYQLLAGMNLQLERYAGAERWLRLMLNNDPGNIELWRQLASVQSLDRRQVDAAATLRLAYEAGLRFSDSELESLVGLQLAAGAPWQAARLQQALLQQGLLASNRQHQQRLAQMWQMARDHERAEQAWRALAQQSGRSDDWMRLAVLQLQQGRWDALAESIAQARKGADAGQRQQLDRWQDYARQMQGN
ncbi:MAG: hypothetical protein CVV07_12635 [Gammaproteobacteria bacterium HGW-Gammaproteobacteria-11]|nr:MAG: hypothetical protein CVV07_12635 [Gammaproteobacteria bacterium HGW-Gammaproteobacteria-11]